LPQVTYFAEVPFKLDAPLWQGLKKIPFQQLASDRQVAPTMQLACDDQALYVRLQAFDQTPVSGNPAAYENDCFEFYFSPGGFGHKGETYGAYKGPPNVGVQLQVAASRDGKINLGGLNNKAEVGVTALARRSDTENTVLIRVPWTNPFWGITPFDAFKFTANATHLDYTEPGKWARNVYVADPEQLLFRDTSRFVPFEIGRSSAARYAPVRLPKAAKVTEIPANFTGQYNLEEPGFYANSKEFGLWMNSQDVNYYFDQNVAMNGSASLCIDGSATLSGSGNSGKPGLLGNAFMIEPGETIVVKVRARSEKNVHPLSAMLISQQNWKYISASSAKHLTPQWQDLEITLKATDIFAGFARNARIVLSIYDIAGDKVWIAERRVLRMTPAPVDLQLAFPGQRFNHFLGNEERNLEVRMFSAAAAAQPAKLKVVVKDYLTHKEVFAFERQLELLPGQELVLSPKLEVAAKGVFEIQASLSGSDDQTIIVRSQVFTLGADPGGVVSDYYGMFNHGIYSPMFAGINELAAFTKRCGINKVCFAFVDDMTRVGEADYRRFALLDQFVGAYGSSGFHIGFHLVATKFGAGGILEPSLDRTYDQVNSLLEHYKGKIEWLIYGSELNLFSDGRERAIQLRVAYNAAKQADPRVKSCTLAPLNEKDGSRSFDVGYFSAYHQLNGTAFSDGIAGVHCYNFSLLDDTFKYRIKDRAYLNGILPGFALWDTESGLVLQTAEELLFLMTKTMPEHLCAGITRQYVYDMANHFVPGNAVSVALPAMNFQVVMYHGATPLGYVELSPTVIGYLFRRPNGTDFIVFWRTMQSAEAAEVTVPVSAKGALYDQFGNVIKQLGAGAGTVRLDDRYVRYVSGVDFAGITKGKVFIPAYPGSTTTYKRTGLYANCVSNPYLVLEPFMGAFDKKLQAGVPLEIAAVVRNDSPTNCTVNLTAELPPGITGTITPAEQSIAAGAKQQVSFVVTADQAFRQGVIRLGGAVRGAGKMAPLTFSAAKADEAAFNGYSRFMALNNDSAKALELSFLLNDRRLSGLNHYTLTPAFFTSTLKPGETVVTPIQFTLKDNALAFSTEYFALLNYRGKEHQVAGKAYQMRATAEPKGGVAPWAELRYSLTPDFTEEAFSANAEIWRTADYVRFLVKVKDPSPAGNDDKLILGFDVGTPDAGKIYGKEDFECGFSPGANDQVYSYRYSWTGQYGLESAPPFPQAVRKIERRDGFIYYDIVIPYAEFAATAKVKNAERIGFSMMIENKTKTGKTEKIKFGGGLERPRKIIEFGILLLK
ncbi:MAG: hypothetical protein WCH61_03550, partial [bacterium]